MDGSNHHLLSFVDSAFVRVSVLFVPCGLVLRGTILYCPVLCKPYADGARGTTIHRYSFVAEGDDPSAERAPLHNPQTGARRQSNLAQAEPMPIVQIDAVHDNARVQRTVMQCHSRVGRVTNRA